MEKHIFDDPQNGLIKLLSSDDSLMYDYNGDDYAYIMDGQSGNRLKNKIHDFVAIVIKNNSNYEMYNHQIHFVIDQSSGSYRCSCGFLCDKKK